MKKNIIIVAVILVLALFSSIYAMSDDGGQQPVKPEKKTEAVQAQNEQIQQSEKMVQEKQTEVNGQENKSGEEKKIEKFILKNVWPDQEKSAQLTEEKYNQVRYDYFEKAKIMGEENRQVVNDFWDHRVNVNKIQELKDLDALPQGKDVEQFNSNCFALFSQLVVIGTVKKIEYDSNINARYKTTVEVEANEVIAGDELFPSLTKIIYIVLESDLRNGNWNSEPNLKLETKYLFYLTRYPLEFYARYNDGCLKGQTERWLKEIKPMPDNINDLNVFAPYSYSTVDLEAFKRTFKGDFEKYLNDLFNTIKKIFKINDKANFYNRSYK